MSAWSQFLHLLVLVPGAFLVARSGTSGVAATYIPFGLPKSHPLLLSGMIKRNTTTRS